MKGKVRRERERDGGDLKCGVRLAERKKLDPRYRE